MERYIRSSENVIKLSDVLKRVVCIKFCDDLNREPTKLAESSQIYATESMADYLPDDNFIMTYTDGQLLGMYKNDKLRVQMESLIKPELLLRIYHLCRENLTPEQIAIIKDHQAEQKIEIGEIDVEHLLETMHKCKNIQYSGLHPDTNLFILDPDGNIRTEDCLTVLRKLTIDNWDKDPIVSGDPAYLGDILIVFQVHADWVDDAGNVFDDLCIYVKVDLNQTTGDSILLVTMHPADHDDNLD